MQKVVHVKARFRPVWKEVIVKVPVAEVETGLFGRKVEATRQEKRWQQSGWSDTEIDSERLAEDLQRSIDQLNAAGFGVISVTPIISGAYNYRRHNKNTTSLPRLGGETVSGGDSYGYGYGYSFTDSLVIVASKTEDR